MHTEAAVLFETGKPLRLVRVELPELQPGQILVDVAYSGVCHSQLLEVRGLRGPDRFLPHLLGHEGSGIVRAVGPSVGKVQPGQRVILSWIKGSGADVPASRYGSTHGPINAGALSTFARQAVTCENRVTPIPDAMPLREAALLGCAIPTGAGVVLNAARVRPGSSVAVFGVGGVGMSAVLAADLMNAGMVVAVDVLDHKLEQARRAGATHVVNARQRDPVQAIRELTGGRGVDYAIEAAGRPESMEAAFEAVCDNGGLCVLAGNLPHGERMRLNPFDLIRGKRLVGTWGGECQPDRDLPLYVGLYLAGKLHLERLASADFPLHEVNRALDELERGALVRGMLDMAA